MIGTRGVPTRYGGFETAIKKIGRRLAGRDRQVLVYCCNPEPGTLLPNTYLGMRLVELPSVRNRNLETLLHMALSVAHLLHRIHPNATFVFNTANSPFLPVLRAARIPATTHVGGLRWRRGRWGPTDRRYYRAAEALAVRYSDTLITDAQGIANYYTEEFNAPIDLLACGTPRISADTLHLTGLDLSLKGFRLVVARFGVENHVDVIVEGHVRSEATLLLVVVGSAPYADDYTARIESLAGGRARLLGDLWDQGLLDVLYSDALVYFHDHSVGGTNPSLLHAVGTGATADALDVSFNREVPGEAGRYRATSDEVAALVVSVESDAEAQSARGEESHKRTALYDWDEVASGYEALARRLALRDPVRRHPSGHRTRKAGW